VACSPCGHDKLAFCPHDHLCMKRITAQAVAAEALAMLSGAARPGGARRSGE
jgi:hypothetical protein